MTPLHPSAQLLILDKLDPPVGDVLLPPEYDQGVQCKPRHRSLAQCSMLLSVSSSITLTGISLCYKSPRQPESSEAFFFPLAPSVTKATQSSLFPVKGSGRRIAQGPMAGRARSHGGADCCPVLLEGKVPFFSNPHS